ncbi:alpha/beta fold hydrolase [Nocardia thailandica]|uniref:alpha/beta fold hydrolase n=1 Tax=Nocardia thailandica TaxID=257275 RepID=UPI0002EA1601|nr:alpha/beta hydrolase [Nocardia thailandica]
MPKIGRFTSEKAKAEFLRAYDALGAKWPVPYTDLDVETSFGTTRVRASGSGDRPPIMLLPGIGGNGMNALPFVEALTEDRVVYSPDVIGWAGRCVQTAPVRTTEDIARWGAEVIDGLGGARVHLAGNSLGAWLAGAIAVHRSDRLASLTMFEPSASTFAKPRLGLLLKFLFAGINPTPERMRKLNSWLMPGVELSDEEFAVAIAAVKFRMAMPWDRPFTDAQLAGITAPALILFGADTVVADPQAGAARVRAHMPTAIAEIVPDIGHDLLWANPEVVIPRFLDFVEATDRIRA